MNRMKSAELTSGIGALVLGIGLGALFPQWFGPAARFITLAGLTVHAFGMWDKHRAETADAAGVSGWIVLLYWTCWVLLAALLALLLLWRR